MIRPYVFFLLFSLLILNTMANDNVKAVTKGNNGLTSRLYGQLSEQEKGKNIFFSPTSVHTVLSLLQQGAEGVTEETLSKGLAIPDKARSADGFKTIMTELNNVPNVTLEIANKVYVMEGRSIKQAFLDVATKSFFAEAQNVNFAENVGAAKTINTWVEKKTNDKIKDLIKPDVLDADTRMVLVNAIYFKGDWKEKFDKENTKEEDFYVSATETVKCQMMHKTHKYNYKEIAELDAKVVQIPYKNEDLSLVIILPNERDGINQLEEKLKTYDLSTITDQMHNFEVILSLPKFKIETDMDLTEPLKKIGFANIFSNGANFSGLLESNEPLAVSKVVQKAFIEVNEEGSEAAAATGMMIMMCSLPPPPKNFIANHPFTFMLLDKNGSGNILFNGKLSAL